MVHVLGGCHFLITPTPTYLRLIAGALLCSFCLDARADTSPPISQANKPPNLTDRLLLNPPPPIKLPATLTNVNINYADVAWGASVKLLDSKVSFKLKDAAFLSVLDALLASAKVDCTVECRGMKAMQLTMEAKNAHAAPLLDSLAKGGGGRLWVFPTKLLLAPESSLTKDEIKTAKLYGILVSPKDLTANSPLRKVVDKRLSPAEAANIPITFAWNNTPWIHFLDNLGRVTPTELKMTTGGNEAALTGQCFFTASFDNIAVGDALGFVAHNTDCELFLTPDEFLICHPDKIPAMYKNTAIPAYTLQSTHFDFGSAPLDPSDKGS